MQVKQRDLALLENDVKTLPLRHKRTYRRYEYLLFDIIEQLGLVDRI